MNDMEKAYAAYRKLADRPYTKATTAQLNVAYNVLCRVRRDPAFAAAIRDYATPEGEPVNALIEKYFSDYNNSYGLHIEDTLTEFDDFNLAAGGYFVISTDLRLPDGTMRPTSPIDLSVGDTVHLRAEYFSHGDDMHFTPTAISYVLRCDGGVIREGRVENTHTLELDVSLNCPGAALIRIIAEGDDGKPLLGSENGYGGLLFSKLDIRTTRPVPADLADFWRDAIDRLMRVDPRGTTPDGYSGNVVYDFDMPSKNFFSLRRVDVSYLADMRANKLKTPNDDRLDKYDVYELYLKAPGPCHASAYVSVPRSATSRLPIRFVYDGYGCHSPSIMTSDQYIYAHCSHHGYELAAPDEGYYTPLNADILKNYGRANGKPNSDFNDKNDCYLYYMLLRNLQVIRFLTDPALSYDVEGLHDRWNGEIILGGGSMGGYQTVCVGGLLTLLAERSAPFVCARLEPGIPAFGDLGAEVDPMKIHTGRRGYEENSDYFDAAMLATLIRSYLRISRVGLGDETCISSAIHAMFNSIPDSVPKEAKYLQNSNHGYMPEESKQSWFIYKNTAAMALENNNA